MLSREGRERLKLYHCGKVGGGTQLSTFASRSQIDVFARLTRACANAGHLDCLSPSECQALFDVLETDQQRVEDAARFDIFVPYRQREHSEPNLTWPTAALVRCVETLIVQPPWGQNAFRRSVWITSALARLGERGFNADAVLRTCLAPSLKRRLSVHIATAWHTGRSQKVPAAEFPYQIQSWLEEFERITGLGVDHNRIPPLEEVLVKASTGDFGQFVDTWIATTATAHVVGWQLDDALTVEVLPTDVVLPGGATATRWVFDRFSQTYLDDWQSESLSWELSYAQAPELTASRAGVPLHVLEERPSATSLALEAIVRRHTGAGGIGASSAFGGVDLSEIQHQIVFLATAGDIKQAQELARAATEKTPHHADIRNAFAFSLIPTDPDTARSHFERDRTATPLSSLNIIACLLAGGKTNEAQRQIVALRESGGPPIQAWLWSPKYLLKGPESTIIQYYESPDWLADVEAALAS